MAKLPKRPKAPKASASLTAWENYKTRLTDWEKKVKDIHSAKDKKAKLIKDVKAKIGRIK